MLKSVHLENFPNIDNFIVDEKIINSMDKVRAICSCALFVRDKHNLRVRLPLKKITIITSNIEEIKEFSDIIIDEINVKNIEFLDDIKGYGEKKLILNFPKIGSKIGSKMPNIIKASKSGKWKIKDDKLLIDDFELNKDEYSIDLQPTKDGVFAVDNYDILIILDTNITEDLEKEGLARDLIRKIQQFRKDVKLDVSDKIDLTIKTNYDFLKDSINMFKEYIKEQTLSLNLTIAKEDLNAEFSFCEEINNNTVQIGFTKINL